VNGHSHAFVLEVLVRPLHLVLPLGWLAAGTRDGPFRVRDTELLRHEYRRVSRTDGSPFISEDFKKRRLHIGALTYGSPVCLSRHWPERTAALSLAALETAGARASFARRTCAFRRAANGRDPMDCMVAVRREAYSRPVKPQSVPYAELSALARVEAHRKQTYRPPYYVHKWWARRTGSVFRGLALDLLGSDDVMRDYYRAHDFSDVVCLDPFMGGGTGVGELLRLGCKVVGCDLNPVAWFLVSQALNDVDPDALDAAFEQVERRVARRIGVMYLTTCHGCGRETEAQYTGWVKQVACTACGDLCELKRSQVIMADFQHKGGGLIECDRCLHVWRVKRTSARVQCPGCRHRFRPSDRAVHPANYRCRCGNEERILAAVEASGRPPSHRMRFLDLHCDSCGRRHQRPSQDDLDRYAVLEGRVRRNFSKLDIPREEIPAGYNTDQLRRYGYRHWHELFSARQLHGLSTLFRAISSVEDRPARELLTLHASSVLEFNSLLCSAKGLGTGAIRHAFAHHALIPAKEPLEAHLWGIDHRFAVGGSSGGFKSLYERRLLPARRWALAPTERRPARQGRNTVPVPVPGERLAARTTHRFDQLLSDDADMLLLCQSSERLPQIPDSSVHLVVTDPPFADAVMYSELSDYFYVWLRNAVGSAYPCEFGTQLVDDRREAVHNPGRGRDAAFYTEVLAKVFTECNRVLKADGRLAFTFHHAGEVAWQSAEDALVEAGFVIERYWPVFAEMESGTHLQGKPGAAGHLDIVFVCAPATDVADPAPQEPIGEMGERLAEAGLRLVAADHRALLKARDVQRATWERAQRATATHRAGNG
jgi:putative DNA methylase